MQILTSFTRPHAIPNPYCFISSVEHQSMNYSLSHVCIFIKVVQAYSCKYK